MKKRAERASRGNSCADAPGRAKIRPTSQKRRIELLRSTSFFRDASAALLKDLADRCRDRELSGGEILCEAGDAGDSLFIVDAGTLEIYLGDAPLDTAGHGACLGEISLITDQPRTASIRALDDCRILVLDRRNFSRALNDHPGLAWGIFRELSDKIKSSIDIRVSQHQTNRMLTEAFERSVSRVVMDEILSRRNPAKLLEGATKEATVLFADVRSFTALSESMRPRDVIDLLNEYLSAMVDVILDAGGTLDKFMGDGVLAIFGVPLEGKNDAVSALRCAGQMQARLRELNESGIRLREYPLNIGVGLATGAVVAGCVGSERRMEYTVIGDVVNLASRMEGLTKLYDVDILCCAETARQAGKSLGLRRVDVVRVKGKAQATELWTVQGETVGPMKGVDLPKAYDEAFAMYAAGDFEGALKAFDALGSAFPGDGPSRALGDRCRGFAETPPEGWDGVFNLTHK